jgi:hypothetical protein
MGVLSISIQSRSEQYNKDMNKLSSDVDDFNTRAANRGFSSQAQFNNERASLIQRTNKLDADRVALNADIDTFNRYYVEYEEIAKKLEVLNSSIDSFKKFDQVPSA